MLKGLNLPLRKADNRVEPVWQRQYDRIILIVDAKSNLVAEVRGESPEDLAEIMAASPETLRVFEDLLDLFQGIDGGENEDNEVFARAIAHRDAMRARLGLPQETIKEG